jgi:predicted ATPase
MPIESLTVAGYRGFASPQTLRLAVPNGENGSGLTMLVGPNSGGKSTVIEAFRSLLQRTTPPSFSREERNGAAGERVSIKVKMAGGPTYALETIEGGGSETKWTGREAGGASLPLFVLPSRRYFNPYFNRSSLDRANYTENAPVPAYRGVPTDRFPYRLFNAFEDRARFDEVLSRILDPLPELVMEKSGQGPYYLKVQAGESSHSSDGMGEGLVSLLTIVDALYDSGEGSVIVIDEPELSLHPSLQRKLATLLAEYATDRQIVYATHSPYFLNISALFSGAQIARLIRTADGCRVFQLDNDLVAELEGLQRDVNNPHILGLSAREAFFLDDRIVLVEGQEDVVIYPKILEQLGMSVSGEFFGWGVGGADKMAKIAGLLRQLGFQRVAAILDGDKKDKLPGLREEFPDFLFLAIPADDVRCKKARPAHHEVEGLADSSGVLDPQHSDAARRIFEEVESYLAE